MKKQTSTTKPTKGKRFLAFMGKFIFYTALITLAIFLLPRVITGIFAINKIHSKLESTPDAPVAIVFGAGLTRNGTVTRVLKDRVDAAAMLYNNGNVQKLLMSGDNRFVDYNEPAAMQAYAISIGIPFDDIVLDYAGRRTYDTCYRAKEIFGVTNAVLVTQRFHLPRALFLCNALGVDADGFNADMTYYLKRSRIIWNVRELPATLVALVEIWFTHPVPVLGEPEPIY